MKVLFFVLNNSDLLSPLLKELDSVGIHGCTILNSDGMGRELAKTDEFGMLFGTLRTMLKPNVNHNKTLMMVTKEEMIDGIVGAIEKVVGPLEQPGTGIVFTMPIDYVKGCKL